MKKSTYWLLAGALLMIAAIIAASKRDAGFAVAFGAAEIVSLVYAAALKENGE